MPALGLLLLGYPLHAPGQARPAPRRALPAHPGAVPVRERDADSLAGREALTNAVKAIKGPVTMHWLESADHGYRPKKASGRTVDDVAAEVAEVSVQWVQSLPARRAVPSRRSCRRSARA